MRKSWKVARWEFKRNIKNKSFLISMLITPVLFLGFMAVGYFFGSDEDELTSEIPAVYTIDEAGVTDEWSSLIAELELPLELITFDGTEEQLQDMATEDEELAYMILDEEALSSQHIVLYTDADNMMVRQMVEASLGAIFEWLKIEEAGLTADQADILARQHLVEWQALDVSVEGESFEEMIGSWVPGIFAGVILLAIVITGMMSFNSSMQEKKDKLSETLLSSLTANDLMQGKIIGYFLLGMMQVGLWILLGLPLIHFYFDFPVFTYLFVPELALYLLYALAGYLLFSAMYVALGSTIDDLSTAGNFQGLIMMLPFLPFPFFWIILSEPFSIIAHIGSYFPFTTSAVMIARMVVSDEIAWYEIIASLAVLYFSVWLMIRLAGKIYRVGILMYGKNASLGEMIKWLRQ